MNNKAFFSSLFALAFVGLLLLSYNFSIIQETSITDITDVKRDFFLARMFLDKHLSALLLQDFTSNCGTVLSPYSLDLSNFQTYFPRCEITKQSETLTQTSPSTYNYTLSILLQCTNNNALYQSSLNYDKTITMTPNSSPPPTTIFSITDTFSSVLEASDSAC